MNVTNEALDIATQRLDACYAGAECDWNKFFQPRWERANFATRYHLVYPALAYFIMLKEKPELKDALRPRLNTIYTGLLDKRVWNYWYSELDEVTWPLQERNLTYAGRLATFVGFYIDAFGAPPHPTIGLDGRFTTYTKLSENLQHQMTTSPSCGVTCYHHQAMVMCNAHMLINNIVHDRLFGTSLAKANEEWFKTVNDHLLTNTTDGPMFFLGTEPNSSTADKSDTALGSDVWALFLMSGVFPEYVREWFGVWRSNISYESNQAFVDVTEKELRTEQSAAPLATAWAFCLARELGDNDLAALLRNSLSDEVVKGFELDPLISGLYVLGETLSSGAFHRLVYGS